MQYHVILISLTFLAAFAGFALLMQSHRKILRYFYVPAGKSASNARLLAGLPMALTIIAALLCNNYLHSRTYSGLIYSWCISSLIVVTYGFWDDKYEIRAKTKLLAQVFAALLFAILASQTNMGVNAWFSFPIIAFCGLALTNGTNLLDGLDTMTIKLSSVSFLTFAIIGVIFNARELFLPAFIFVAPLWAFYYFNREPSRLHLGEIGGSFLGFGSLLLGCMCFTELRGKLGEVKAVSLAILPFIWPVTELASSFLRRLYVGKSPFQGDRLHVHHILKTDFSIGSTQVTNILAASSVFITLMGLMTSILSHPLTGFFVMTGLQCSFYLMIARDRWLVRKKDAPYWDVLISSLKKKQPCYIAVTHVDHLQVRVKKRYPTHIRSV